MYYSHFGLKLPPFRITADTEFFFPGGQRGAILDALVYAVSSGEGIVKVVGEVGSGKTMLCRMLQSLLPQDVETVYLANPSVAPEDILHAIAFELQLALPDNADRLHVMHALQEYLLARHSENRRVVIFVEEAQGMPLETLEEIRLLSNLETRHDKLLQIILFGQPELDVNLNQPQIRQLRERITHSFNLGPLEEKDIGEYIMFRMRAAGYYGPPLFSKGAIRKIAAASRGLVRRVNILADKALLAAFAESVYAVKPKHVDTAIRDSEFDEERAKTPPVSRRYGFALAMLGAGLGLGVILHMLATQFSFMWPEEAPSATLVSVQQAEPMAQVDALVSEESLPPLMEAEPVTLASTEPSQDVLLSMIAPGKVDTATTLLSMTTAPANTVAPQVASAVISKEAAPAPAGESATEPADILEARLLATRQWLSSQPPTTASIQILGTTDAAYAREQIRSMSHVVDGQQLFAYRHVVAGEPYITVLFGSYADKAQAHKALKDLPKSLKTFRPKLRTVEGIKKDI